MRTLVGIFLDSGRLEEIQKYHALGILRGVTTNPTILLKDGVGRGGWERVEEFCTAVARLIDPLPVSVEVTSNDPEAMRLQAHEIAGWAPNINVKIPIHGPDGGTEYLRLVHTLERTDDIRVNVTAMMSAQQAVLAAAAGATYVSLFGGRINNMGYDSCQEVARLRKLLDALDSPAKIIVGSTREVLNIIEWFEAGADIVTTVPTLLEGMLVHPYSLETVRQFLKDGAAFGWSQPSPEAPAVARAR